MIFLLKNTTPFELPLVHGILASLQCKHRYHDFLYDVLLLLRSSASERPLHHGVEQWSPLWVVPCKACLCVWRECKWISMPEARTMNNHDGISWNHSISSIVACFVVWQHAIPPRHIAKSRGFILCQMLRGQKQRNQGSTQQICSQLAQIVGGNLSRLDSAERFSSMGIYNILIHII